VVAYGATARSARQAVELARGRGRKVGLLKLKTIWPFPEEVVEQAAERLHHVVVPEMNMGQLVLEVERVVGRHKVRRVNRADGEMIQPAQILAAIEEWEWTR
jgi:2-oxoglutarate ferredoxin oxidoreductase subunit alpha